MKSQAISVGGRGSLFEIKQIKIHVIKLKGRKFYSLADLKAWQRTCGPSQPVRWGQSHSDWIDKAEILGDDVLTLSCSFFGPGSLTCNSSDRQVKLCCFCAGYCVQRNSEDVQ